MFALDLLKTCNAYSVENVTFFDAEDVRFKNQSNLIIFVLTKMVTANAL